MSASNDERTAPTDRSPAQKSVENSDLTLSAEEILQLNNFKLFLKEGSIYS